MIRKDKMRNSFSLFSVFLICLSLGAVNQSWAQAQSTQSASVFVSPRAKDTQMSKVAVLPFKAPVELAGASIADVFTTEILKTYKYRLIERSQMEQVLDEKALGMQGVISSSEAIQIGKLLGVEGVILGTVPEYGLRAVGEN
ncbi:MAG: CsgG/HfaB family protein, partial [Pseudomonadota bacterium]